MSKKLKKHHGPKDSDIQSDISSDISLQTRKRNLTRTAKYIHSTITWIYRATEIVCEIIRFCIDSAISACVRFQKWRKELSEAPVETKEKYFFLFSTIVSTFFFFVLFTYLDFMITKWFTLPAFITRYSFSISYCISYLTSVVWQHFFNQYFVFYYNYQSVAVPSRQSTNQNLNRTAVDVENQSQSQSDRSEQSVDDTFCDSLLRTYLVYAFSLFVTGVFGSCVQIFTGIGDQFVLCLTLPISGVMNYYLLRFFHQQQYQHHIGSGKGNHNHNYHRHQQYHVQNSGSGSGRHTSAMILGAKSESLLLLDSDLRHMDDDLGSPLSLHLMNESSATPSKSEDRVRRKFVPDGNHHNSDNIIIV